MTEGCEDVCEASDFDSFSLTCLKQTISSFCKIGKNQWSREGQNMINIGNFRTTAVEGLHEHGVLHVWRWNAFPRRSPWGGWYCCLQKSGDLQPLYSLSWFWCDNAKPKYGEYIAGKIETFSRGKHLLCKPFDFHTAAYIWSSPLSQCLPDEVAKLRDDRRELERQRQHQQDLLRSEVIHSEDGQLWYASNCEYHLFMEGRTL